MYPRLWIAPLSKEIIEITAKINNANGDFIGFIISENQVSKKGYTGFTVPSLRSIANQSFKKSPLIIRDHCKCEEEQLKEDCLYLDGIHIDPFKLDDPFKRTLDALRFCETQNSRLFYEIGTEEAIFKYDSCYLEDLLLYLKENFDAFGKIKYAVIQSGTKLKDGRNTGEEDLLALRYFWTVCYNFGKVPKIHNGDYLSNGSIQTQNSIAPLAINIAPEVGFIQSCTIYDNCVPKDKEALFKLCMSNKNTLKWFSENFDFFAAKRIVVSSCLHYNYQNDFVQRLIAQNSTEIKLNLYEYLVGKLCSLGLTISQKSVRYY